MFLLNELHFITSKDMTTHNTLITNATIDGRKIEKNGLYIPIKGENNDGHDYLEQAINNGAIASLWEVGTEPPDIELPEDFILIPVDSTYDSLHHLASFYRNKVNPVVIGITGSNGKTTTKDLLYSILSSSFKTHKTQGNLNNHYGVPLTLLSMSLNTEVAIIEMGMSGVGEISELSILAKPDYAIITNIGESHLAQLKTRENIALAKSEITDGLKNKSNLYCDGNEPLLSKIISNKISFGSNKEDIKLLSESSDGIKFEFLGETFFLPLLGAHHAKNASYAIAIALKLGLSIPLIKESLRSVQLTGMRMELSVGVNNSSLYDDTYNASPTSMKGAINTLNNLDGYNTKILILGDMFELGSEEESLHRGIAHSITNKINYVFLIGEKSTWIYDELLNQGHINVFHMNTFSEIVDSVTPLLDSKTVLLAKASRGMQLNKLMDSLKISQER